VSIDGERGDWTEHESLRLGECGGGDMGWWAVAHVIGISFLDVERDDSGQSTSAVKLHPQSTSVIEQGKVSERASRQILLATHTHTHTHTHK
jgi:hypothetical protein